jgi:hypothetical protein
MRLEIAEHDASDMTPQILAGPLIHNMERYRP